MADPVLLEAGQPDGGAARFAAGHVQHRQIEDSSVIFGG